MGRNDSDLITQGLWFGRDAGAAFGWLSHARTWLDRSGVLILPPVGYAWWSAYATRRVLAERLVATGHTVLRLDYHGTGDAPGSQWESDQFGAWHDSVRSGARALRERGCTELTIVGVALGATLALELAEELEADRVVAWHPVISGRHEARALGMRSIAMPDGEHVSHAGSVFATDTLSPLSTLDLLEATSRPERTLVIDGPAADPLVERLADHGADAERVEVADGEQALQVPAEDAVVARGIVDTVVDWIGPGTAGRTGVAPGFTAGHISPWGDGRVREEIQTLGPSDLVAVACGPAAGTAAAGTAAAGTVVMLNSGSEPHVGPGRAWVELARTLAVHGIRSLRVDFRGWGESPDDGYAPGRPYDAHGIADTLEIVRALQARGDGPIVLVGLCAGAWVALRAILDEPVAAVIALNPQLYWQPGDPVEALLSDTRRRRAEDRAVEAAGRESERWDERDRAGERNWAGAWLDDLAAGSTQVTMLFAEDDDGLEYLRNRLGRRLAQTIAGGRLTVTEIPGIDHAMHRAWLRPAMFAAIEDAARTSLAPHPEPAAEREPELEPAAIIGRPKPGVRERTTLTA
jgi:pimeloyl-ACP methyl ester carboxylesterase